MKVAICGSRDYPNLPQVARYVQTLPKETIIVSGGARGVDREAEIAAYLCGLAVHIIFADWKQHGKKAGILRNEEIVNYVDRLVLFWDGKSRGTAHTGLLAKKASKPCEVFMCRRTPKGVTPNDGQLQRLPVDRWKRD